MNAIELKHLTKTYQNGITAVKNISLNLQQGDFFALLGANGAGKSTTLGMITSLIHPSSGSIKIHGIDLANNPVRAKSMMGVVPQEFNLNIFESCEQILLNQAGFYGVPRDLAYPRVQQLLRDLSLEDKTDQAVRYLSGGMKRRLMIARALVHHPSILILDEPSAGVDIEIRKIVWSFLKKLNREGTTILLTTHYLEEAEELCKHAAILHHGQIVEQLSMAELSKFIRFETFVFNTMTPLHTCPKHPQLLCKLMDAHHFELSIPQDMNLNQVFTWLTQEGIVIKSLRSKTNRLETLFLERIQA
jgi:ABC-2 type transport system ATP-binding protein